MKIASPEANMMTRPVFVIGRYGPPLKAPAIPVAKKEANMKKEPNTNITIVVESKCK